MKSTTTSMCFKSQKPTMEMLYIFSELSCVHLLLFILFLLFTGFNWRLQTHAYEIFRSSYVSCVLILEMKSTTTNICFKPQKTQSGDALYFFLTFLLFIFFCSSCFFCLRASTEEYKHMHLRFSVHLMFLFWRFFFLLSQVKRYGSLCFFLRCKWFLASSYVSGVLIL